MVSAPERRLIYDESGMPIGEAIPIDDVAMTDVLHRIHRDHGERTTTFEVVQDVQPILEWNKVLRSQRQKSDWGRHVASVPNVIINRWLQEEWARGNTTIQLGDAEFMQMVRKKLADPDWAYLRTG